MTGNDFVGRQVELLVLKSALASACGGMGQFVVLGGEPGIGKTRLAERLVQEADRRDCLPVWAGCWADGGAPEFWPWVQVIRDCVQHGPPVLRAAEAGTESDLTASLLVDAAPRAGLSTLPAAWAAPVEGFHVFARIAEFLRRVSAAKPLLLVFDDLHLADVASLRLLRFMVEGVHLSRILVLGTYRDTEVTSNDPLGELVDRLRGSAHHIVLRGLDRSTVSHLLETLTGASADEGFTDALLRQTGGNPLFVREVLQLHAGDDEGPLASLESLRDVIERRLDWLSPGCQEVLGVASVVGQEFQRQRLEVVSERSARDLAAPLNEAVSRRLVERMEVESPRYRFTHPLIREIVYQRLDTAQREWLHYQVACAIEDVLDRNLEQRFSQLSYHLQRAGGHADPVRLMEIARQAGEMALRNAAHEQAVDQLAAAACIAETGQSADMSARCELLLTLAQAQMAAGRRKDARATCGRVAELSRTHGLVGPLVAAALGVYVGLTDGVVDEMEIRMLEEALEAVGPEDSVAGARLLARLAVTLHATASVERRMALCAEALAMARRLNDEATLAAVLYDCHTSLFTAEKAEVRLVTTNEVIGLATRIGDDKLGLEARGQRLGNLLELGDMDGFAQGVEVLEQLTNEVRQPGFLWRIALLRATQDLLRGRLAEAERRAAEGLELGRRVEYEDIWIYYGSLLAVIRYLQGRLHELEPSLRELGERHPATLDWQTAGAAALAEAGRLVEAREIFERLAADDFSGLHRGYIPIYTLALLATVCDALSDARRASTLHELLSPYASYVVQLGQTAIGCLGSASHYLGLLDCTLERWDEASGHFEAAIALNRRIQALPFVANSRFQYARALRSMGDRQALARADGQAKRAHELAAAMGMRLWGSGTATALVVPGDLPVDRLLTPRQRQIARLVAEGCTDREIATRLFISRRTAEKHVEAIRQRLKCSSRSRIVALILQHPGDKDTAG